ncbi:MAG: hypothetical protein ACHQ9S_06755 [Candidatus Binatia bacterium]
MESRGLVVGLAVLLATSGLTLAQATPTPVDSSIAVSSYAQGRGEILLNGTPTPCTSRGGAGCGGCYPVKMNAAVLDLLPEVNPEWQPIGPMINGGPDTSLPPQSQPVTVHGTVALTQINVGGDFAGSHLGDDQNTFIQLDASDNGILATGNQSGFECGPPFTAVVGQNALAGSTTLVLKGLPPGFPAAGVIKLIGTTPVNIMYTLSGTTLSLSLPLPSSVGSVAADTTITAGGENCGLIEMELEFKKYPLFAWAGEGDRVTAVGRWIFDCGHPDPDPLGGCSNNPSTPCIFDGECGGNLCNSPAPTFNYRSELHPPQAIAVLRNKSNGKTPATQADVYVSADGGGAGDACTVTHQRLSTSVLFQKSCFLNHCSATTSRSCTTDADCASGEQCLIFDATQGGPVANINASNFEFDMPLPKPPSGSATLQINKQSFQPQGGIMPEPLFTPPTPPLGPTPSLHVVVPMSVAVSNGKMPNVFAERITAYWKEDLTELTHVQINFLNLLIKNPLKTVKPVVDRVCTNPNGGLFTSSCTTNANCAAGACANAGTPCYSDQDCTSKTDFCSGQSVCVGGIVPGWELFGEVNGDWIQFNGLTTIGAAAPFAAPPYIVPGPTPLVIPLSNLQFDEYVPSTGTIHIATTGHSLGCTDANLYGRNLKDPLLIYGLSLGAACVGEIDPNPGNLDVTHTGPNFATASAGVSCIPPAKSGPTICTATSSLGDGGTCSITTSRLCLVDNDCPAGTCSNNSAACHTNEDCGTGNTCSGAETCNATCSANSGNAGASCHIDADCTRDGTCDFGGAFALQYAVCAGDCNATSNGGGGDGDGCAIAANRRSATAGTLLNLLAVLVILAARRLHRCAASRSIRR